MPARQEQQVIPGIPGIPEIPAIPVRLATRATRAIQEPQVSAGAQATARQWSSCRQLPRHLRTEPASTAGRVMRECRCRRRDEPLRRSSTSPSACARRPMKTRCRAEFVWLIGSSTGPAGYDSPQRWRHQVPYPNDSRNDPERHLPTSCRHMTVFGSSIAPARPPAIGEPKLRRLTWTLSTRRH